MANPVTLAEVQQHLRLGTLSSAEQAEINMMIDTATEYAENFCNRAWTSSSQTQNYSSFPLSDSSPLVINSDVQSITSIGYYDTEHVASTFTLYRFVNRAGRTEVYPAYGEDWPADSNNMPHNITITYVAGNEAGVPSAVKSAVLLLVGDLYENRENAMTGQGITQIKTNLSAERLLTPYKTRLA